MVDFGNSYLVVFTDQSGTNHMVPFDKTNDPEANRKAERLVETLRAVGLNAYKHYVMQKPAASKVA